MVVLHVKRGDDSKFLLSASVVDPIEEVLGRTIMIYNGCLKIHRICFGIEYLAEHGYALPPEMHGLTEDQIADLKLSDEHEGRCIPSGGYEVNKDPYGRRCGQQPVEKMRDVLLKTVQEAKAIISEEQVKSNTPLTSNHVYDALDMLKGAVTIVYPMGLPAHDPIREELENREDLSGTHGAKMILDAGTTQLWFAGKKMLCGKKLSDYVGKNEKSKVVVKLQRHGEGPPGREPSLTQDQRNALMAHEYKRREELKWLEACDDDSYLDSTWADRKHLHRAFQGLDCISWKPH